MKSTPTSPTDKEELKKLLAHLKAEDKQAWIRHSGEYPFMLTGIPLTMLRTGYTYQILAIPKSQKTKAVSSGIVKCVELPVHSSYAGLQYASGKGNRMAFIVEDCGHRPKVFKYALTTYYKRWVLRFVSRPIPDIHVPVDLY
jgi:hypothetical protein